MNPRIDQLSDDELRRLGRSVCETTETEALVRWAGRILHAANEAAGGRPSVRAVVEASLDPSQWETCHALFSAVRDETLDAERDDRRGPGRALLYLAENVAKLVFNASGAPMPFDPDVGEWVPVCAAHLVRVLDDPAFATRMDALVRAPLRGDA